MTKKIDVGRFVVPIIENILAVEKDIKLIDKKKFKLSMEVWFDIENDNVKAMTVEEVKFKPLNKLVIADEK